MPPTRRSQAKKVEIEKNPREKRANRVDSDSILMQRIVELEEENREVKEKIQEMEWKFQREIDQMREETQTMRLHLDDVIRNQKIQENQMEDQRKTMDEMGFMIRRMNERILRRTEFRRPFIWRGGARFQAPPITFRHAYLPIQAPPTSKKNELFCVFCDQSDHNSTSCSTHSTWTNRRWKCLQMNLCRKCLKPNNFPETRVHSPCPMADEQCPYCMCRPDIDRFDHHPILCRYNYHVYPQKC